MLPLTLEKEKWAIRRVSVWNNNNLKMFASRIISARLAAMAASRSLLRLSDSSAGGRLRFLLAFGTLACDMACSTRCGSSLVSWSWLLASRAWASCLKLLNAATPFLFDIEDSGPWALAPGSSTSRRRKSSKAGEPLATSWSVLTAVTTLSLTRLSVSLVSQFRHLGYNSSGRSRAQCG